jgi:hypothetical protein
VIGACILVISVLLALAMLVLSFVVIVEVPDHLRRRRGAGSGRPAGEVVALVEPDDFDDEFISFGLGWERFRPPAKPRAKRAGSKPKAIRKSAETRRDEALLAFAMMVIGPALREGRIDGRPRGGSLNETDGSGTLGDGAAAAPGERYRDWPVMSMPNGHCHLRAVLHPDGALSLEGQDLGRDLPFAGIPGVTEYEYTFTLDPGQVPRLVELLGGGPDDDVLDVVVAGFPEGGLTRFSAFFEEHGIKPGFWNHFDAD